MVVRSTISEVIEVVNALAISLSENSPVKERCERLSVRLALIQEQSEQANQIREAD
jgi:hypothetical protein